MSRQHFSHLSHQKRQIFEVFDYVLSDPKFKVRGEFSLQYIDENGKVIDEKLIGKNVITTRARFVMSRLIASNMKRWLAGTFVPHADWTTYYGDGYIGDTVPLGVVPGSYAYPFADTDAGAGIGGIFQRLKSNSIFGGVQTEWDNRWNGATQDITQNTNQAFHHGNLINNSDLLYALGITGFCFGNGGHLLNPTSLVSSGVDTNQFCLADYNSVVDYDVPTKPAQPWNLVTPTDPGYSWPGGGVKANYPNLHQPDTFVYESVMNGVVPWGYAGVAGVADNLEGLPGTRAVYEGNTTLYSETARYPLDIADGIQLASGNEVVFKCTVPADSELNQERNYGYGRRPRNWITEMGLITGENLTVQSPDPRTVGAIDPTTNGISNVYGAQLVEPGWIPGGTWYGAVAALPKDYFTRLRDPDTGTWFLDANGQLVTTQNNTWNLVNRKVFGVETKTYKIAMAFTCRIYFG
jgi:hypothetical protein